MYQINGKIIHGDHYGRILGFPTANIDRRDYRRRNLRVRFGVWAGSAEIKLRAKNYKIKAAIVIGPKDRKGLPKIEAHLLGFKGDLYGKKLTIYLHKYLRPFKKFKSERELKEQIQADILKVKK
jgi:riboflavin kinase / FMN adenylyltransferase